MKTFTAFDFLTHEEGFSLKVYADTGGIPTVGWGHTGPEVILGDTWTLKQCQNALQFDMSGVINYVNNMDAVCWPHLTQNQFNMACDLIFNWGQGNFENEAKSFLHDIIDSDPNDPVIRKVWTTVGIHDRKGNLLSGLVGRRNREVTIWFTPDIQ